MLLYLQSEFIFHSLCVFLYGMACRGAFFEERRDQGGGDGGIVTGASLFNILLAHSYFNSPGVRCCVLLRPALPRSLFAIVLQALEISFACPAARRRYLAFICRLSRCNSMGAMNVSASRTSTGVALNAHFSDNL